MAILPSRKQYQRWSLPSKWTFWAGVMAIASLIIGVVGIVPSRDTRADKELNHLILQVAQELRYNTVWLNELAVSYENRSKVVPVGRMKLNALVALANTEFKRIVTDSYGEEKYIYQEIYTLSDLADGLGSPETNEDLAQFNARSKYTLHDVLFLNEFLRWYLRPLFESQLTPAQMYTLGGNAFPDREFKIYDVKSINLKYFTDKNEPITQFDHYLGLID